MPELYTNPDPPTFFTSDADRDGVNLTERREAIQDLLAGYDFLRTEGWQHLTSIAPDAIHAELDFNGSQISKLVNSEQYEVACTLSVGFGQHGEVSWTESYPAVAILTFNGLRGHVQDVQADLRSLEAEHRVRNS